MHTLTTTCSLRINIIKYKFKEKVMRRSNVTFIFTDGASRITLHIFVDNSILLF